MQHHPARIIQKLRLNKKITATIYFYIILHIVIYSSLLSPFFGGGLNIRDSIGWPFFVLILGFFWCFCAADHWTRHNGLPQRQQRCTHTT